MNKDINQGRAVLGVDLDGVCCDYVTAFRPYAANALGVPEDSLEYPTTYNIIKAWGFESPEHYKETHRQAVNAGLYKTAPLLPGAAEALQELSNRGAHIRIVTHRLLIGGVHKRVVSDTADWLDTHKIPYMSLCFTGLKDSIDAHAYIEDAPQSIDQLRKTDILTFVYDQPYNRDYEGPRIYSWAESIDQISAVLPRMKER